MVIQINIVGFSDKIFEFAKIYLGILHESANEDSFQKSVVRHSIEKIKTRFANNNNEVDSKAVNNRLLMLIPHTYSDKLMERELKK